MNLSKMLGKVLALFAVTLSILLMSVPLPASADLIPTPPLTAKITGGSFTVDTQPVDNPLTQKTVVRQAILTLPRGETGTISSITITDSITDANPAGKRVFGCTNVKVKNGTDLIKACGGPSELSPGGKFRYQAQGSGFGPKTDLTFQVKLFDNFKEGK
jgi:hypothetical protein